LPARAFAEARPLGGRLAVRPTAFTPNLPPEAARRFDVPMTARPLHGAAGPRIVPVAPGARAEPELRRAALPQNLHGVPAVAHPGFAQPHPGEAARPGVPALRPGEVARPGEATTSHGLPALRAPGAHPEDLRRPGDSGARAPALVVRPGAPAARPEVPRSDVRGPEAARPEQASRPGVVRPGEVARPEVRPQATPRTETRAPVHPEPPAISHEAAPHEARPEARRPAEARPAPREAPRAPRRPEEHEAPHAEARPAPRPEGRPAPRPEARPAPRPEAARPEAHHAEPAHPAPRPAGHPEEKHAPHH